MGFIKKILKFWFWILVICAVVYVGVLNLDSIEFTFPWLGVYSTPKVVALLGAFFIGVTLTALYFLIDAIKKSAELHSLRRNMRQLQQQLGESVSSKESRTVYNKSDNDYSPVDVTPSVD